MPTTFVSQRTGRAVSDTEVRSMLDRRAAAPASTGRQAFTDRLGLPATATNAEILAAVDAKLAQRTGVASHSAEEQLFARVTGRASETVAPVVDMSDEALWARLNAKSEW